CLPLSTRFSEECKFNGELELTGIIERAFTIGTKLVTSRKVNNPKIKFRLIFIGYAFIFLTQSHGKVSAKERKVKRYSN
ncbi:MAG: hypothetical protein WBF90_23815, partial [Rivularia sp. (in: cyanobacteria)]